MQRRADSPVRACVQCGTYVPLDQTVLVRQTSDIEHLTLAPLSLSDPAVLVCCSSTCAEIAQNEIMMQRVMERAGPRPACQVCGQVATWIDPLTTWMCSSCGATVKEDAV